MHFNFRANAPYKVNRYTKEDSLDNYIRGLLRIAIAKTEIGTAHPIVAETLRVQNLF